MKPGLNEAFVRERLGDPASVWNRLDYTRDGLVEASAGTGKTYALQSVVLKLLVEGVVDGVRNILLVTFTEKAAGELRDRIRQVLVDANCLPDDFDEVNICTIHSFCRELLTEYAFENGVPMKTEVGGSDGELARRSLTAALRTKEYEAGLPEAFDKLRRDAEFPSVGKLLETAGKRFGKGPLDVPAPKGGKIPKSVLKTLARARLVNPLTALAKAEFERSKAESSMMSFDDMIADACRVIDSQGDDSELLKSIRRKYRIALVDEFQDTDARQWKIFSRLFSSAVNRVGEDAPKPRQGFLLAVGDPKQAIYSFRGADVNMYLEAKARMTDVRNGGQERQSLNTTFRSSPELVDAFNRMFGKSEASGGADWFAGMTTAAGSITYGEDVKPPPESVPRFRGFRPCDGFGKAVTLLESLPAKPVDPANASAGYGNNGICLPTFVRNAAAEMKRLRGLNPAYQTVDPETDGIVGNRFAYRDMCVLVHGKGDAAIVERILTDYRIPFAYYKEQGVYDSAETESVLAVFDYLADPGRKGRLEAVLLTPFCAVPPSMLEVRLESGDAAFSELTERWLVHVSRREWGRLFDSMLNDTCIARPRAGDFEYDRRRAALQQILDGLLAKRGATARSIAEFADELRVCRKNDRATGGEGTIRRKESEADCVQIMTMHVSKGLEFKVVFVAYGFGRMGGLSERDEKAAAKQEVRRLLYVALTRAECKLYLPWSEWARHRRIGKGGNEETSVDEVGLGSVGSALLIKPDGTGDNGVLGRGILACFGGAENAARAVEGEHRPAAPRKDVVASAVQTEAAGACPVPIVEYDAPGRLGHLKLQWDSYTSLDRHVPNAVMTMEASGRDDEESEKSDAAARHAETLLPRSGVSGDVFHEIMEALCGNDDSDAAPGFRSVGNSDIDGMRRTFGAVRETPFARLVRRVLRRHGVVNREKNGDSTELTLARMVWSALNTPVTVGGMTFRLKDVDAADRRAEMEFVIDEGALFGADLPKFGGRARDGLFNGKIDLLVRPNGADGLTYVVDWKTNSLASFDADSVADAMNASGYVLQYRLYSLAVDRWLGGGRLGGVAYLFVRGGERTGGRSGVYAEAADDGYVAECRKTVLKALSGDGRGGEGENGNG